MGFFTLKKILIFTGDAFELTEFHEQCLWKGQMPMPILEKVIEAWISDKLGRIGGCGDRESLTETTLKA